MPRRKKIIIDPADPIIVIGTSLPWPVIEVIDRIVRRTLSSRASWVRKTVLDRLAAEGYLDEEDLDEVASA